MNRIERIEKMEQYYDTAQEAVDMLSDALDKYEEAQKTLFKLIDYFEGPLWLKDFEADEAGKLPKDLKRGVLSEDGLYNLLTKNHDAVARMSMAVSIAIDIGAL